MKLKANEPMKVIRNVAISTDDMSVMAIADESKIIIAFEVIVKKKKTVIPVINGAYMTAWLKVYGILKPILK